MDSGRQIGAVMYEVEIPQANICSASSQDVTLLARSEFRLSLLQLSNIVHGADEAYGASAIIEHYFRSLMDHADLSAWTDNPVLCFRGRATAPRCSISHCYTLTIIGVDPR